MTSSTVERVTHMSHTQHSHVRGEEGGGRGYNITPRLHHFFAISYYSGGVSEACLCEAGGVLLDMCDQP